MSRVIDLPDRGQSTSSAPVVIDIARMQQAVAAKRFVAPQGLSPKEIKKFILHAGKE